MVFQRVKSLWCPNGCGKTIYWLSSFSESLGNKEKGLHCNKCWGYWKNRGRLQSTIPTNKNKEDD